MYERKINVEAVRAIDKLRNVKIAAGALLFVMFIATVLVHCIFNQTAE